MLTAKEKGARWLESQQLPDGFIEPRDELLLFAYKAPWALAGAGRTGAAARLLAWIARHEMSTLGDFFGRTPWGQAEGEYLYQSAWLAAGAHRLGRFDLSTRAIDFLFSLQDPVSGGVFSRRDGVGSGGRQEIWISGMVGLAALFAGRTAAAEKVGRFLQRMRALQPDFERALYFAYTPAEGLVTEFSAADAPANVIRTDGRGDQWYFLPGLAAAFLTRLYLATGNSGWLGLAEDYLGFAERCPPEMFATGRCGKVGWGAALLYQVTGQERHRELALRAGRYLVESQLPDGRWTFSLEGWPVRHAEVDVTAEFVGLLDEMLQGLQGLPA
jgi:hypothetical protein